MGLLEDIEQFDPNLRRERIATAALQGLLANPQVCTNTPDDDEREWVGSEGGAERMALDAIKHADALIAGLSRPIEKP